MSWIIGGDYDDWKTTEPPEDDEDEFDPSDDEPDLEDYFDEDSFYFMSDERSDDA